MVDFLWFTPFYIVCLLTASSCYFLPELPPIHSEGKKANVEEIRAIKFRRDEQINDGRKSHSGRLVTHVKLLLMMYKRVLGCPLKLTYFKF